MRTHVNTPSSSILTVRLKSKVKADLERLSKHADRSRSYLAAEAIEAYVAQEMAIVRAIHRGIADVKAGRVVSHEEAMRRLDSAIEKAAQKAK